jgi:hypothetical protein
LAAVPLGLLPTRYFRIAKCLRIQRIIFHFLFALGRIALAIVVLLHLLLLLGLLVHADVVKTLQAIILVSELRYILKVSSKL